MRKINGVLRWSRGTEENGVSITGMAYANRWHSTDQIPERAVTDRGHFALGQSSTRPMAATPRASASRAAGAQDDGNSHGRGSKPMRCIRRSISTTTSLIS